MSESLTSRLLQGHGAARVAIWLLMGRPNWFTADEIAKGMIFLRESRIQQVLRWMYSKNLVERRTRQSNKQGPEPYEYRLTSPLIDALLEKRRLK
jgi:predicted transcriptional regulator